MQLTSNLTIPGDDNMEQRMIALIDTLQQDIFAYHIEDFSNNMMRLIEMLTIWVKGDSPSEMNVILKKTLDSYEKKDYLLLADVLEFELKPLLAARERSYLQ